MSRFERLYRDNFPFVWAAARRCGAPDEAVGDVVQDVFVTAHRRLDELSYEVSPRGWLYGVTRRVAFRYRRSAARTARRKAAVAHRATRVEHPHARHEAARELDRLLAEVDDDQRRVFEMTELLGMTGPEIAAELRVPLPTVYSRLRLARRRLEQVAATPDTLEASVDAARRIQAPPSGEAQRTWAALLPVIASPLVPVKLGLAGLAKSWWLPFVAVSVVAVAIGSRTESSASAPIVASSEAIAGSAAPPSVHDVPATAPSPDPGASPPAATPVEPAPPKPIAPAGRGSQPEPAPIVASAETTPTADALALEVRRLEEARRALRAGEADRALSILRDLDEHMPEGQLLDARGSARVRALCELGRDDDAAREAERLHRAHPDSNVALGTPKKCAPA